MKKLLATLAVYLDLEETQDSSAEQRISDREYEITLRPNADKLFAKQIGLVNQTLAFESIMAHELGHFISEASLDPTHSPIVKDTIGPLAGETHAWTVGKEILPNLNTEIRDKALATYRELYDGRSEDLRMSEALMRRMGDV